MLERKINADKTDDDDIDSDEAPFVKHKSNNTYTNTHHVVEYLMGLIVRCVDCFLTH